MIGRPLDIIDLIVAVVSFTIGFTLATFIWLNRKTNKEAEKRLTRLQVTGIVLFVSYMASPLVNLPKPDSIIAIGLLSLIAGENIGTAFAKLLERTPYVGGGKE